MVHKVYIYQTSRITGKVFISKKVDITESDIERLVLSDFFSDGHGDVALYTYEAQIDETII